MTKQIFAAVCALVVCVPVLVAQQQPPSPPTTVSGILDRGLGNMEREFVPAAEAMPDDKFDFAPTNGEFKGVRTFALQVRHVAAANYQIAAAMLGEKPPAGWEADNGPEAIKSKAEIVKYLKDSIAYARKAFATVSEKNLTGQVQSPLGPGKATRLGLANSLVSHAFDHYGQMVEYLRMNGIIPPASRQ